jgi:hypothetical protein
MTSYEEALEKHIQKNDLAIEELSIRIENLNREVETLLSELNVSHEQLSAYVEHRENFSDENWETLQKERKALDEKLLRELINVRDPRKAQKAMKELRIQPHWLFVR